jgi:hypothetical protein
MHSHRLRREGRIGRKLRRRRRGAAQPGERLAILFDLGLQRHDAGLLRFALVAASAGRSHVVSGHS